MLPDVLPNCGTELRAASKELSAAAACARRRLQYQPLEELGPQATQVVHSCPQHSFYAEVCTIQGWRSIEFSLLAIHRLRLGL